MKKKTHRGFETVAKEISRKQGIALENARAILAKSGRNASAAAKRKNPRLLKISGAKKH
ncbi:MAG: hypothetical protein WC455_11945 [Dehalococcoidia bacterium]|jgi:hypothetical protein